MRFVLAVALAASVAGAAWAAPVKVASVTKTSAVTETVKDYSTAHCWICRPADLK